MEDRRVRRRLPHEQIVRLCFGDAVFYNVEISTPVQSLCNNMVMDKKKVGLTFFNNNKRGQILANALSEIQITAISTASDGLYTGCILFKFEHADIEALVVPSDLPKESEFQDYLDILEYLHWEL
jgi:hypothetical protein